MAVLTSAIISWQGLVSTLVSDKLTVPNLTVDSALRVSQDIPTANTLHNSLLGAVNGVIANEANEVNGIEFSSSFAMVDIEIDLSGGRSHKDDDADSTEVWDAIQSNINHYSTSTTYDENGRVAFTSVVPDGVEIQFRGDIEFNEDGKPYLVPTSATLVSNGKVLDLTTA